MPTKLSPVQFPATLQTLTDSTPLPAKVNVRSFVATLATNWKFNASL